MSSTHRYLRKDDLYVHADLHGAATTIVRNNDSTASGQAAFEMRLDPWLAEQSLLNQI